MNDDHVARDPWRGVHDALRSSILTGVYPPGSRLFEQQLADRFGTSRGPVRTALRELERTGLVVSIDRRGTFVRSHSTQDVDEILSLWEILWPFVVKRAVERIGPKERLWLEEFQTRTPPENDAEAFMDFGILFTREVFRMASHRRAEDIFESITTQARALFVRAAEHTDWVGARGGDFVVVCRALLNGDVEGAVNSTRGWVRVIEAWSGDQVNG